MGKIYEKAVLVEIPRNDIYTIELSVTLDS